MENNNIKNFISNYWVEYSRISNRTYQTQSLKNQEDYIHRGYAIGHQGGNDFDQLTMSISSISKPFMGKDIMYNLRISNLRDGANGLDTPWESWRRGNNMDSFIEDFPTKPINYIIEGNLCEFI